MQITANPVIQVNENKLRSSMPKSAIILKVEEEETKKKENLWNIKGFLHSWLLFFYSLCFKNGLVAVQSIIEVMGRQGDLRGLQCAVKSEKVQLKLFFLNLDFSPLMLLNQYFLFKKNIFGVLLVVVPCKVLYD